MLDTFISTIKRTGLARTNRYTISIPFPIFGEKGVGQYGIQGSSGQTINLLCDSVQIPGMNISTDPARIFGEDREMPYERTYEPFTTTFYVDSNLQVKTAFDNWMSMIIDPKTRTIGYYRDYVKDIKIHVENVDDSRPLTITVFEAYPKSVMGIQMSYSLNNVMSLSVTWQYRYWKSENLTSVQAPSKRPIYFQAESDPQGIFTKNGMGVGFNGPVPTEEEIIAVENRIY